MKTFRDLNAFLAFKKVLKNYKLSRHRPRLWRIPGIDLGYIKTTKVASTSIELCLASYLHETLHGGRADEVDASLVKHYEKRYSELVDIRGLEKRGLPAFLFTFVRNPLNRLYSCYVNKIVDVRQAGRDENILWSHDITLDMTFEQFVKRVAEIPDEKVDRHLRSQYCFLWDGQRLIPDFVGRFETIGKDWQILVERFGLPDLPHANESSKSRGVSPYTQETAKIAALRYSRDIELFGYKEDVCRLIKSL